MKDQIREHWTPRILSLLAVTYERSQDNIRLVPPASKWVRSGQSTDYPVSRGGVRVPVNSIQSTSSTSLDPSEIEGEGDTGAYCLVVFLQALKPGLLSVESRAEAGLVR